MMLPLWDVDSHPEHLLLEVLLVVTQSAPEEEEAGAVGLTLTHKTHTAVNSTQPDTLENKLENKCEPSSVSSSKSQNSKEPRITLLSALLLI